MHSSFEQPQFASICSALHRCFTFIIFVFRYYILIAKSCTKVKLSEPTDLELPDMAMCLLLFVPVFYKSGTTAKSACFFVPHPCACVWVVVRFYISPASSSPPHPPPPLLSSLSTGDLVGEVCCPPLSARISNSPPSSGWGC